MVELHQLTIAQQHAGLIKRAFTPLDLLAHYQERIARFEPTLNTLVAANPHAEAQAAASTERYRQGTAKGPLDGIPGTVKDNIPVKGMPCSWGSVALMTEMPEDEEPGVTRLREAGCVILGKTNCPEFTLEGYTSNAAFGTTANPYNPKLTPGGSSGGAVAGLAAGLCAFAIGTDGGGSIRRPAGHTGLVGLKPSIGRIPRAHTLPPIMVDLEVIGPLTRTVADCQMVYEIMQGFDPADHRSALAVRPVPSGALTILLVEQFGDNPVDPAIRLAVQDTATELSKLGHRVETGPLPLAIDKLNGLWPLIGQAGLAWLSQQMGKNWQKTGQFYRDLAEAGRSRPAADYLDLMIEIQQVRAAASQVFETVDLILTPTAAAQPWPAAQAYPTQIDGQDVGPRGHAVFTGWVNAIGHPAMALPAEPDGIGMPIGYQLVAGLGQEQLLLNLAAELEAANPWAERWPIVS